MRFIILGLGIILLMSCNTIMGKSMYKLHMCRPGKSFQMVFRSSIGARRVVFVGKHKELVIKLSTTKGIVGWNHVKEVEYRQLSDTSGVLSIHFNDESEVFGKKGRTLKFGEMEKECWQKLVSNFEKELIFKVIKV